MTASSQTLRAVIAGLGVMGSHHLRLLRDMRDVEIVAVVDVDRERGERAVADNPGARAYESLTDALEAHELDFACIALPVAELPGATHAALDAGLNVLVEKPMAPDEEQALGMIRAAESRGLALGVGHVERFNPAVVALRDRLEEGLIGRVHQLHARRLSPFPNRDGARGVSLDLATHDIDVMRFVTGEEVERVYAEVASPLSGDNEDLICATVRFGGDATGLLEVNWMTPTKVRQISILGERGMFVVDYLAQNLVFYEHPTRATEWDALAGMRGGGEGDMVRYALNRREPLRVEWEAFLEAIRTGERPPVDGHDGLAALSTALAIRASGARHETVVPGYRAIADDVRA